MALLDFEMKSCSWYAPSNHLHEMQVLLFCKLDARAIFSPLHGWNIADAAKKLYRNNQPINLLIDSPPTKRSRAWFIQIYL